MSTPIVSKEPENKVSTEVLGKEHTTTQENIANTTESTKMSSTPKDGTVKESGSPKSKSADQRKEAVPLTSAGQVVKKQTLGKPVISTSDEDEDDDDSQTHADDRLYKTVTGADGKPKKIFGDPTSSNFILNDPDGNTYYVQRLIPFCKKHKLLSSEIYKVCTGRFRQHRGWTCQRSQNSITSAEKDRRCGSRAYKRAVAAMEAQQLLKQALTQQGLPAGVNPTDPNARGIPGYVGFPQMSPAPFQQTIDSYGSAWPAEAYMQYMQPSNFDGKAFAPKAQTEDPQRRENQALPLAAYDIYRGMMPEYKQMMGPQAAQQDMELPKASKRDKPQNIEQARAPNGMPNGFLSMEQLAYLEKQRELQQHMAEQQAQAQAQAQARGRAQQQAAEDSQRNAQQQQQQVQQEAREQMQRQAMADAIFANAQDRQVPYPSPAAYERLAASLSPQIAEGSEASERRQSDKGMPQSPSQGEGSPSDLASLSRRLAASRQSTNQLASGMAVPVGMPSGQQINSAHSQLQPTASEMAQMYNFMDMRQLQRPDANMPSASPRGDAAGEKRGALGAQGAMAAAAKDKEVNGAISSAEGGRRKPMPADTEGFQGWGPHGAGLTNAAAVGCTSFNWPYAFSGPPVAANPGAFAFQSQLQFQQQQQQQQQQQSQQQQVSGSPQNSWAIARGGIAASTLTQNGGSMMTKRQMEEARTSGTQSAQMSEGKVASMSLPSSSPQSSPSLPQSMSPMEQQLIWLQMEEQRRLRELQLRQQQALQSIPYSSGLAGSKRPYGVQDLYYPEGAASQSARKRWRAAE